MVNQELHVFEEAGLGKAPFRFLSVQDSSVGVNENGMVRIASKSGVDTWTKPGGSCDFCGTYIVHFCWIKSADGKEFKVGSDCVRKTGDQGLKKVVAAEVRLKRSERRREREMAKIEKLDHNILRFGKYKGMTIEDVKKEDTDYLVWIVQNMTAKAHARTIKLIEEAIKGELAQVEEVIEKQEELEKQKEEKRMSSIHISQVGRRIELELTHTGNYSWDSMYGTQTLYFFEDSDGNAFVWKTTSGLSREVPIEEGSSICSYKSVEKGEIVKIRATIKGHDEYKGQKQTTLTRVKLNEN